MWPRASPVAMALAAISWSEESAVSVCEGIVSGGVGVVFSRWDVMGCVVDSISDMTEQKKITQNKTTKKKKKKNIRKTTSAFAASSSRIFASSKVP